ncbi:MAG: YkgJ family cysteine cluster protein [Candidatus Cloacimonetes bacterium]|nr:YkgJ family cysteine cluster protein [Candidatus Cloacimonadota bacterium]
MENICAICHKKGLGCCLFKKNSDSQQIGIFIDDINKIANFLKVEMEYFVAKDEINDYLKDFLLSTPYPLFDKIFHNNIRYKLKTVDEKCIFLTDKGCELPLNIRPLFCRVYPFWPSKNFQHIYVLSSSDCLAQEKSTLKWEIVNNHFNYSKEYLVNLFFEMKTSGDNHISALSTKP